MSHARTNEGAAELLLASGLHHHLRASTVLFGGSSPMYNSTTALGPQLSELSASSRARALVGTFSFPRKATTGCTRIALGQQESCDSFAP